MFGTVDDLDDAVQKMLSDEPCGDVERMVRIAEQVEFLKLREIAAYDRSGDWAAEGFVSTASALRAKCRMVPGIAHSSLLLARKLEVLPETAAAFGTGEISRHHAEVIARAHTPERATMIEDMEGQFANLARLTHATRLRDEVKRITDAFDGDGGAADDGRQHALNKVTLSPQYSGDRSKPITFGTGPSAAPPASKPSLVVLVPPQARTHPRRHPTKMNRKPAHFGRHRIESCRPRRRVLRQ